MILNLPTRSSNTAGYSLSEDKKSVSYTAAVTSTDLFTLSGVKSTTGIVVDSSAKTVTLTADNLNDTDVTITSDDYTLLLADGISSSQTTPAGWSGSTYKSASNTAGYSLSEDKKSVSYTSAMSAKSFTLTNLNEAAALGENLIVTDGDTTIFKFKAAALDKKTVTITGDDKFSVELDDDVDTTAETIAETKTFTNGTLNYLASGTGEYYTATATGVSYTAKNGGEILFTISGIKSIVGLSIDTQNKIVTISVASLNQETVTISNGYTLKLADDVKSPTKFYGRWVGDNGIYTYTGSGVTAGYKLIDNKIVYSEEIITGDQYTLHDANDTGIITESNDTEITEENSLNKHNVVLIEKDDSNSGNNIVFDANTTRVTVGSGRDSLLIYNDARAIVDMTNADDVTIVPYSGRVTLEGYDTSSGATILYPKTGNIVEAVKDNSVKLVGNRIQFNSDTSVQINNSGDSIIVNLVSEDGSVQKVGFTKTSGGELDTSKFEDDFLLKGNYAENSSDNQKHRGSIITAGKGNDTILAGSRDFVDGGNGRNQIFLTPYDLRQIRDGATIASSGNGRNTIHGFHEGFGYDGDVIQVKDFNNLKFKFDTDGLLLTANDSRIKFDGIGITSATTDDSTNSLGTNRAELIQITNGSSTMRTAVAQTNQSILVQEDDYITPNAFFGNRSGLNFSEYNGNVEINLTDGTGKLGKWDATFKGINKLQAGNGMSTLIGDDTRNTLIAGTGYTSMWGGAGNDKLIGKGNSTDKDGRTTFFFFAGDGRDVISDFTFLTPENRYDGIDDRINVGNSDINNAYRAGNNVVVVFDQNSYLILEDAVGKDFQIANMIAKVDRNIAYDGLANCYVASGGSSLTVDSTVRSAEIWLDNSHGTQFFGNIRTLDASAVEGNTSLVGNEFNNTIIAGQGDSSLWGGFSPDDDLLIGGNSRNTFFYCMGNGNDTIQGTNDKDFVILSDVSLDQIIETSISADSVSIRFTDGGSLQIQGTADITYQLADGSKYSASHERLEWDNR